jgi:hypothetical protein
MVTLFLTTGSDQRVMVKLFLTVGSHQGVLARMFLTVGSNQGVMVRLFPTVGTLTVRNNLAIITWCDPYSEEQSNHYTLV